MISIQCLAEGDGDVRALPVLLRRMVPLIAPGQQVTIPRVVRAKSGQVLRGDWHHLELAARIGRHLAGQPAAILVLLDTDGEICPAQRGPVLLGEVRQRVGVMPCELVLAEREFETWFLAAAESLAGQRGLPEDLRSPLAPESIRGAKEWLSRRMPAGRRYRETIDQPALAAIFDLEMARGKSPSFDKFWRAVECLLRELARAGAGAPVALH